MADSEEKVVYRGGPSQMLNLSTFIICALILLFSIASEHLWKGFFEHSIPGQKGIYFGISKLMFVLSIYWAFKAWLVVKSHKYQITSERLSETEGILSRTTHELELFRVRDITFSEPLSMRIVGCGDIILNTTDKTTPIVVMHGIKDARPVMEILRKNVDAMRTRKGVRDIEL